MTLFNKASRKRVTEAYEDSWLLKGVSWALFIGLLAGLITVAIINIKPYTIIMSSVSANANWIFRIPLLGTLLKAVSSGSDLIASIFIWLPVQILQCLWLFIKIDAKAQKNALRQSLEIEESITEKQKGGRYSRKHAKRVSSIPFFFIQWAAALALAAYTFDLVVGMQTYPLWQSWESFGFWAKSLNPIWINGGNLRDLLVMLFSFEAVLIPFLVVKQWVKMGKGEV